MIRFALAFFLLWGGTPAFSEETNPSLTAWYQALEKADVAKLEAAMIAEDFSGFEYRIKDLGVVQNRAEFIESMAEWVGAIAGGSIAYKVKASYEGGVTALVCYRFSDGEFLAEEEIGLYDTKITSITQIKKDDRCPNF